MSIWAKGFFMYKVRFSSTGWDQQVEEIGNGIFSFGSFGD